MPEALETDSLIGTVIGALARVSDDATEAAATLKASNDDYLTRPMLLMAVCDALKALESISLATNLAEAAARLLKSEIAA